MSPDLHTGIDKFTAACHKIAAYNLLKCSSGNVSWRIDDEVFLITASRSWIADLTADDVTVCRFLDRGVVSGRKPSVESVFHRGVLMNRPEVNVVLHFQTPNATTLACMDTVPDYFVIPEIPYYMGKIGQVGYHTPGSAELAEDVVDVMKTHNLAQMRNHGQITVGKDFNEVIQNATFFELACEILIKSGFKAAPFNAEQVKKIIGEY